MIPDGRYRARAVPETLRFGMMKDEGAECIELGFLIEEEGEFYGCDVNWHGFLTEKALPRTVQSMRECGWKGGKSGNNLADATGLGSTHVYLWLKSESWTGNDGKERSDQKVMILLPSDGKRKLKTSLDKRSTDAIARRLEGKVAALERNGLPPAAPRSAPSASDDDIPF